MQLIIDFISVNYLEVISIGLSVIFLLIPNSYKFIKYFLGGVLKLIKKYKTENTITPTKGQTFETEHAVYRVNKSTCELEKTSDVVNIKELVKSNLENCLTMALARLMPDSIAVNSIRKQSLLQDDLDFLQEASNIAEQLKEDLGLDCDLSIKEVFDIASQENEKLKESINNAQLSEQRVKDVVKGVVSETLDKVEETNKKVEVVDNEKKVI